MVRWVGAVALGLLLGASLWLLFQLAPGLGPLPLAPMLAFGVAIALALAWTGLPLLPDPDWKPESPQARALLDRIQRFARRQQRLRRSPEWRAARNAQAALGLGALLLLTGMGFEIFHAGTFSSAPTTLPRIVCFGGALACASGAWVHGGPLGRAGAVLLAAFTATLAWLFFR